VTRENTDQFLSKWFLLSGCFWKSHKALYLFIYLAVLGLNSRVLLSAWAMLPSQNNGSWCFPSYGSPLKLVKQWALYSQKQTTHMQKHTICESSSRFPCRHWQTSLEIGSYKLFAWAVFELWSFWFLPPEELGLQAWATKSCSKLFVFSLSFFGWWLEWWHSLGQLFLLFLCGPESPAG
jgi:hypothetical protein